MYEYVWRNIENSLVIGFWLFNVLYHFELYVSFIELGKMWRRMISKKKWNE